MARINQTDRDEERKRGEKGHRIREDGRDDAAERDSHKLFVIKISAEQAISPLLLATGISEVIKTRFRAICRVSTERLRDLLLVLGALHATHVEKGF